jgi:hypothetical protein
MGTRKRAGHGALATALAIGAMAAQPAAAQVVDPPDLFDTPCLVSNGGRITAANGDRANFGGHAANDGALRGHQVYVDHGPVSPFRFQSLTVTFLACFEDGRNAEMTGTGTVDLPSGAQQLVQYLIRVRDLGELPQSPTDTYRITLSNGYDSGEQPVEHGNIQILFR